MLIGETFYNATEGYRFGSLEPYEPWTNDTGKLFRTLQREYGRCTSSVYVDSPDNGKPHRIGWVFQKRMEYEDYRGHGERYYTREVWVTLYEEKDTVKRTHHYHKLD